ncbi:MAG: protein-tyrosine phosphatase [Motiliproteus sp.]
MLQYVSDRYGTHRGLIRLALDWVKWKLGQYDPYQKVDWTSVKRLVFVCQGNICRSPYGHFLAQTKLPGSVVSIGYATTTGVPANDCARAVAMARGTSLEQHKATDLSDFSVLDGDLFLVMEDRHITKIESTVAKKDTQITLLGLWATPKMPLIYDPHHLSEAYFNSCYQVIESAVEEVVKHFNRKRPI